MKISYEALSLILDSITEHIVVVSETGEIQYANKSWSKFGERNACNIGTDWIGVNYLDECDKAAAMGDEYGEMAGRGIRGVINKDQPLFYFEYPCHSPDEKRWYMMRVTPLQVAGKDYFVISHQNISERKFAEEEVINLARIDGLTNIPNRRAFDEFLHSEWLRCLRLKIPMSLALLDLDHFKLLNDTYGHQAGDECLIQVGALLKKLCNRPGDICARYGGEEFVMIWGDTSLEQAKQLANKLLEEIAHLNIANRQSPVEKYLTASIGLAEIFPSKNNTEYELISQADTMLYKAKNSGRNRVVC